MRDLMIDLALTRLLELRLKGTGIRKLCRPSILRL